MVLDAAAKHDQKQDVRTEASMVKVFATEMATEVIDCAMQTFGAMGVTKELPLQLMAQKGGWIFDDKGKYRAMDGYKDDIVMESAIAIFNIPNALRAGRMTATKAELGLGDM